MSDHMEEQEMEAEALTAIFDTTFEITSSEQPFKWRVSLYPEDTYDEAERDELNHVACELNVQVPLEYPDVLPIIDVQVIKGLSEEYTQQLLTIANEEAEACMGMPAIYAVCEAIRTWLGDNNVKGLDDVSMHAQMIRKQMENEKSKMQAQQEFEALQVIEEMSQAEKEEINVRKLLIHPPVCHYDSTKILSKGIKRKKTKNKTKINTTKFPNGIVESRRDVPSQASIRLSKGYVEKGVKFVNTFKVKAKHTTLLGSKNSGVRFSVETVPEPLPQHKNKATLSREEYLKGLKQNAAGLYGTRDTSAIRLEAASNDVKKKLISVGGNGFLVACVTSFAQHLPLGLSPDHIWTLITYAFAKHVDEHAEELRNNFVQHEGKKELIVETPATFQMSSVDIPDSGASTEEWETFVFPEFSKQIKDHIGKDTHSLLTETFSTTTPASMTTNEIVLMSAMKNYFSYVMVTRCGIPNITLTGTEEDWVSLRSRTEALGKLMKEDFASYWMPLVLPILDQFIASYKGNVNHGFWQSMVKLRNNGMHSGYAEYISGWIQIFFPYLKSGKLNLNLHRWEEMYFSGPEPAEFPTIVSSAPVSWDYHGTKFKLNFNAGISAVSQDAEDGMLSPDINWYVSHDPPK